MTTERGEFMLHAIKEVGFPIVAFFIMAWMCFDTIEANTEAVNSLARAIELMD